MTLVKMASSVLLLAGLAVAAATATAAPARPNIVFVLADDLGWGDLGAYGQKQIKTPHLDRMAAQGMRFHQAYAGSTVCAPSRSVLMTGQHTGHTFIRGNSKANLRPQDVTVAEVLKQAGYRTALFGKWGLGHERSTGVPTKKGFDEFFGYLDQTHAHNTYPTFLVRNETRVKLRNEVPDEGAVGQGVASKRVEWSHDLIMDEAFKWIETTARGEQPFFLYLAPTLPHANNEARGQPDKAIEVPDQGLYARKPWPEAQKNHAAIISRLDADVGRLLALLAKLGIDRRTIVFFTSDNGPHREGGNDPAWSRSSGPFRGIKRELYDGGIRVPAIVRWPGTIKAGVTSRHPWAFWDFLPTAAELAGATDKVPQNIDGLSFVPALLGKEAPVHDHFYWEFHERAGPARAVLMGRWKVIEKGGRGGPVELYDLTRDPAESKDVAAKHADVVARGLALMNSARTDHPHWPLAEYRPEKAAAR
jgi:uncharacterized sulfatase